MSQDVIKLPLFAEDFDVPVDIVNAGDDRLFVVEKEGTVQIIDTNGVKNTSPFLDIRSRVNSGASERGLLGLCFHPQYSDNGFFFVNYTRSDGSTVVARYEVSEDDEDIADAGTEKVILTVAQPFSNHNAGDIEFGPDGYLYIPLGDGGNANDPGNRSQDPMNLLGKMLRIDVDNGDPYAIPPDNPWADDDFARDEIWAIGLRNPWRISFDRETGDLYIADVGQDEREEVNMQAAGTPGGLNYGWRCYEGSRAFNTSGCNDIGTYTFPVFEYGHQGFNCSGSITGGYVYRGAKQPDLYGHYIMVDYCTGVFRSWSTVDSSSQILLTHDEGVYTTFGEDSAGELYIAASTGDIYRVAHVTSSSVFPSYDKVELYPVPSSGRLQLKLPENIQQKAQVSVFNYLGVKVMSTLIGPGEWLDTSDLPVGNYWLLAEADDQYFSGRFVKAN